MGATDAFAAGTNSRLRMWLGVILLAVGLAGHLFAAIIEGLDPLREDILIDVAECNDAHLFACFAEVLPGFRRP